MSAAITDETVGHVLPGVADDQPGEGRPAGLTVESGGSAHQFQQQILADIADISRRQTQSAADPAGTPIRSGQANAGDVRVADLLLHSHD